MSSSECANIPVIVWFRQDLRLADNPALWAAAETGRPVIPVYILDDEGSGAWQRQGASRWWLHHSLQSLQKSLRNLQSDLVLRRGRSINCLRALIEETGSSTLFWNRRYEPDHINLDKNIKEQFELSGTEVRTFNANLLIEPWKMKTKTGGPFRVFSPYWRAARESVLETPPIGLPGRVSSPSSFPASDPLESWELAPSEPDWASGFSKHWEPGEAGARERLLNFLDAGAKYYAEGRDRPDKDYTSGLSPHLAFGEVSPRQIVAAAEMMRESNGDKNTEKFFSEIGWREFSYNLLFHYPHLPRQNYQDKFDSFPWRSAPDDLKSWQRGQTGYPIVDAGMRQLWQTGWMHNRVRMIVASFLIKHLMIDWREGEAWFWDTLVDADLANNAASWQWVAGSGADAAPYFRIFNPITQGEKFDPNGEYVRKWVPELSRLPNKFIHQPWEAGPLVLRSSDVVLGKSYPHPIIDHKTARDRALSAFQSLKEAA